jgi:hypothetical protein
MRTTRFATMPSFILDDPHPNETFCDEWYPRYGRFYRAIIMSDEIVTTPTGTSWPLKRVTFIKWRNGTLYKITRFGWPLAFAGLNFEQAKAHPIYFELQLDMASKEE